MNKELYERVTQEGAIIDLSDRTKIRLSGADRVRYLNGQVTNDVRLANGEKTLAACVTNAKGRIEGDVRIHTQAGESPALFLDAEPGLRESLAARLDRYIVADDVELADVTEEWQLFHAFGAAAEAIRQMNGAGVQLESDRFHDLGLDWWLPVGTPVPTTSSPLLSAADGETLRILRGIPRWPAEINNEAFPQEAGLETTAMSFTKGCYVGQEILSRIKTTGKTPRRLTRVYLPPATVLPLTGTRLLYQGEEGGITEVGRLTSHALHPVLDRIEGLAYVRQNWSGSHSVLLATEDPPTILATAELSPL